jgi:hypothetical protein
MRWLARSKKESTDDLGFAVAAGGVQQRRIELRARAGLVAWRPAIGCPDGVLGGPVRGGGGIVVDWGRCRRCAWDGDGLVTSPLGRRLLAATALTASLVGIPLALVAMVGSPTAAGGSSWRWLTSGLQYQGLPLEPLLAAMGVICWGLWTYTALVTALRLVAVVATRRGVGGSARLLALSNLVTAGPLRSLVDAAVGVSLLASLSHAVAPPAPRTDPPPVVRAAAVQAA